MVLRQNQCACEACHICHHNQGHHRRLTVEALGFCPWSWNDIAFQNIKGFSLALTCATHACLQISKIEKRSDWSFNFPAWWWKMLSIFIQLCPTLCDPMDCSMPGFLVHHQLVELTQAYAHWVGDAIQPFHPLSSPSPLTFNLSQDQGLFKWVNSLHQVVKVLELQSQHQSLQWLSGLISIKIDWFDIFAVQGTLKSLLQHHSSKASILLH